MAIDSAIFRRSELLLGDEAMKHIAQKRVIVFGVGGVGSWCAESLVRSGIRQLTIVDSDRVCITNINRQLMATTKTVGQVKVEAQTKAKLFSSMGAALKLDPTRIKVTEFWKVKGDPLARALRNKFKKDKVFPKRKFLCVYSDELLKNLGQNSTCGTEQCMCPKAKSGPGDQRLLNHEWCSSKAQINGTLAHITAIFGFMLAGLVIQDATKL